MAVGTPVICTDVGAMPEYVVDGETGYVVPPNDPQSLRQRIVSLLDDPSAAKRMGRSGHRHVQQFTWARVAERTLEVYRELGLGKGSSIPRSESSTLP
jgi:D-inositol-3-phosphate glycosyltransferase